MLRIRVLGVLSPKWDVYSTPLHQGSGIFVQEKAEEPEMINDSKETISIRYSRTFFSYELTVTDSMH